MGRPTTHIKIGKNGFSLWHGGTVSNVQVPKKEFEMRGVIGRLVFDTETAELVVHRRTTNRADNRNRKW